MSIVEHNRRAGDRGIEQPLREVVNGIAKRAVEEGGQFRFRENDDASLMSNVAIRIRKVLGHVARETSKGVFKALTESTSSPSPYKLWGHMGGKKGGLARMTKLSSDERVAIAKKGADARWEKAGGPDISLFFNPLFVETLDKALTEAKRGTLREASLYDRTTLHVEFAGKVYSVKLHNLLNKLARRILKTPGKYKEAREYLCQILDQADNAGDISRNAQ